MTHGKRSHWDRLTEAVEKRHEPRHFYFAYGSNMNRKEMLDRCPGAVFIGKGRLPGYRLDFTQDAAGYPGGVADVIAEPEHDVWGLLYQITGADLASLDQYEGYPFAYDRFQTFVDTGHARIPDVWVYVVKEKSGFVPPAGFYLNWMREAAAEFEFPEEYRLFLDTIPVKPPSDEADAEDERGGF